MTSVQRLRARAHGQGNLVSTPQANVAEDNGNYLITPAQPQVIYVPVYDPYVIYNQPVYAGRGWGGYLSWGVGFPIGIWLGYDMDWSRRRVYYDGWRGHGWRDRSRPFVRTNNVYVNARFNTVYVNRNVMQRPVNYTNVERYRAVHNDVRYDGRGTAGRPAQGTGNKIIDRNMPADPRVNDYRGRTPPNRPPVVPTKPEQAPHVFGRGDQHFDPQTTSQRGQTSRAQPPTPPSPPVPRPQPVQAPRPQPTQPPRQQPQPQPRPPQGRGGRPEGDRSQDYETTP
jgi:hypothetical protein